MSLTLVVDSHAMACSLVFSRMNDSLNFLRKSAQVLKPGGLLVKAVTVSVKAQSLADPSFIKERANAIFFVIVVVDIFVDKEIELGVVDPGSSLLWVSIESGWLS